MRTIKYMIHLNQYRANRYSFSSLFSRETIGEKNKCANDERFVNQEKKRKLNRYQSDDHL